MAKKPKSTEMPKKPTESELLAKAILLEPGGGLSKDILDNAYWRDQHMPDDHWVAALDRLDQLGDKKPLTDLLRSEYDLPLTARYYLADLIERGVKMAEGRRRAPAYDMSEAEGKLWLACEDVRMHVRYGKPKFSNGPLEPITVADALAAVAKENGIALSALDGAYKQRRGGAQRRTKRNAPARKSAD